MTKYFLAVDYGNKKCGLAIADEETKIASAQQIIKTGDLLGELLEINRQSPIKKIIFGNFKLGDKFKDNQKIKKIGAKIGNKLGLEVEFQEEIFTTKMAQDNLRQARKSNLNKKDDAESARIILQSWLDKKKE